MTCDTAFLLEFIEKMEIPVNKTGIIFKYGKKLSVERMVAIYERAICYPWWRNLPIAAFLKAMKETKKDFESVGDALERMVESNEIGKTL